MREKVEGLPHSVATFRLVVTLFAITIVAFSVGQYVTYAKLRSERAANVARLNAINSAQCASGDSLRRLNLEDKKSSLAESQQYLKDHPNGAPGIPRDLIERGIERTKKQVKQLEQPFCPVSPELP